MNDDPTSDAALDRTRREIAAALNAELAGFYPVAIDAVGGFRCAFDERWAPGPDEPRLGVFQARMVWVAATVARRRGDPDRRYRRAVDHGVAFLVDHLWDGRFGGFHWQLDVPTFAPLPATPFKHAYGQAFCLYALAAAYALTRDDRTLRLAIDGFAWFDAHAHDAIDGGYHEQLAPDGTPVRLGDGYDLIGTPLGQRSMNAHLHLLEAFTELYRIWPDATLRARLVEVFEVMRDRMPDPAGSIPPHFAAGWRATSDRASYGHDVEGAFLLLEAADALGLARDPTTLHLADRLWTHTLAHGEDREHGGFVNEGRIGGAPTDTKKIWWVQAEALQSLALMSRLTGEPRYADAFARTWAFARDRQIDAVHGGWFGELAADGSKIDARKGHAWKAAYHTARALLNIERLLGGMPSGG